MTVGYLLGTFDLLNVGDLDLVEQVSASSSQVVLAVYSDEHVASRLGRPPVVPLHERLALLNHLRGVDEVVVFGSVPLPEKGLFAAEGDSMAVDGAQRLGFRGSRSAMLRAALADVSSVGGSEGAA